MNERIANPKEKERMQFGRISNSDSSEDIMIVQKGNELN
jgi:hypothetical protein